MKQSSVVYTEDLHHIRHDEVLHFVNTVGLSLVAAPRAMVPTSSSELGGHCHLRLALFTEPF